STRAAAVRHGGASAPARLVGDGLGWIIQATLTPALSLTREREPAMPPSCHATLSPVEGSGHVTPSRRRGNASRASRSGRSPCRRRTGSEPAPSAHTPRRRAATFARG